MFGAENRTRWVKDGINDYVVSGREEAVNPAHVGTKAAARYRLSIGPGQSATVKLRFASLARLEEVANWFGPSFDDLFAIRDGT